MDDLERLAQEIVSTGVDRVFGIPGSGPSLTLLDALARQDISFHLTHFEGSAVLMAGVYGRLTGRAGVAVGIKGPGLANMVPGMAACRLEAFPVVTITEAYPPSTSPAKVHKWLDHAGLTAAVAKGCRFLSGTGPGFGELSAWAAAEVPGPVHLDIAGQAIPEDQPVPIRSANAREAADSDWKQIVRMVSSAEQPVVIAGTLAIRQGWSAFLHRLRMPVFSTAAAKGVVDETMPQAAGVYTGVGLELTPERLVFPQADLVIGLGVRSNEVLAAGAFSCPAINIDPAGASCCPGFSFSAIYDGTTDRIDELFALLNEKDWGIDKVSHSLEAMRRRLLNRHFLPAHAFFHLEQRFDHQARLVLDTGHFCTIGEHMWRAPRWDWCLGAGQGRYMGTGLPMAVGAVLTDSTVPTVVVLGDGGIGMFVSEIKLAVAQKAPLLVVLMTDGYLGSIRTRALQDGLVQGPVAIGQPSWLKVFAGFGLPVAQAADSDSLAKILWDWQPAGGPMYVEIPFDPDLYQAMVNGIR